MIISSGTAFGQFQTSDLHSRMWLEFGRAYYHSKFCDVTFHCNDGLTVKAHKIVLASISPYFKAILYGPMAPVANVQHEIVTSLDYSSSSLRFLLDCVYEVEVGFDHYDINLMEFASLCDFVAVPELFREGLRLAATHLTPNNCVTKLNEAVCSEVLPVCKWVEIICRYMAYLVNFDDKDQFEIIALNDMSPRAMVSLLSSLPIALHTLPFSYQLLCHLCKHIVCEKDEISAFLVYYFKKLRESKYFDNSEGLELLQSDIAKIRTSTDVLPRSWFVMDDSTHNEEVVLNIQYLDPVITIDFVYYPKLSKYFANPSDGVSEVLSYFEPSLETLPSSVGTKFFVWRDVLCAVFFDEILNQFHLLRYQWHVGLWKPLFSIRPEDRVLREYYFYHVHKCAVVNTNFLVVAICKSNLEVETQLCIFDLPKRELVVFIPLGNHTVLHMVHEGETLFLFSHPHLAMKMDFSQTEQAFQSIDHPEMVANFESHIFEFRGQIFHMFCYEGMEGIFIQRLNSETMTWEDTSWVSKKLILYDVFVANDDLFVSCAYKEKLLNPKDAEIDENEATFNIISKCFCKEIESGKYRFKLKPARSHVQLDPQIYEGNWGLLILPRGVFPLDDMV